MGRGFGNDGFQVIPGGFVSDAQTSSSLTAPSPDHQQQVVSVVPIDPAILDVRLERRTHSATFRHAGQLPFRVEQHCAELPVASAVISIATSRRRRPPRPRRLISGLNQMGHEALENFARFLPGSNLAFPKN